MEGYVKIYRSIADQDWHDDPNTGWLFVMLLILAQREETSYNGIQLSKGQIIVSRSRLSRMTGISERSIRTSLERLERAKLATRQTTNKYTIVTICNYGSYVDVFDTDRPSKRPSVDQVNDQVNDQQKTLANNCNSARYNRNSTPTDQVNDQVNDQPAKENDKEKRSKKEIDKERLSLLSLTRTREVSALGNEINDYFRSQANTGWYEGVKREIYRSRGTLPTDGDITELIEDFKTQILLNGGTKELSQINAHFANWLRIRLNQERRNQDAENRRRDEKSRSDAEFAAHIHELLASGN